MTADESNRLRVGISACLLGEHVRYDGGHKRAAFLADTLGRCVEWVPVCPEVECGLGTPRESMRLVRRADGVRLLTVKTGRDLTDRLDDWAASRLDALAADRLSGFVLKKDSPSCGLERVKVYDPPRPPARSGRGRFAEQLLQRCPDLPVEDEGRLSDPRLRENFVERIFAFARLRALFERRATAAAVIRFHTAHKLTLMAHSPRAYGELGRLVARCGGAPRADFERDYSRQFMQTLAIVPPVGRHVNVLHHALGYFSTRLDGASRRELLDAIDDYRRGVVPLAVPVALVRHHVRVLGVGYLAGQRYLDPAYTYVLRGEVAEWLKAAVC